jgi:hypothetical protein
MFVLLDLHPSSNCPVMAVLARKTESDMYSIVVSANTAPPDPKMHDNITKLHKTY